MMIRKKDFTIREGNILSPIVLPYYDGDVNIQTGAKIQYFYFYRHWQLIILSDDTEIHYSVKSKKVIEAIPHRVRNSYKVAESDKIPSIDYSGSPHIVWYCPALLRDVNEIRLDYNSLWNTRAAIHCHK